MKDTPSTMRYPAALTKVAIKKITAITGFFEVITKTLEKSVANAKISIKRFVINLLKKINAYVNTLDLICCPRSIFNFSL